MALQLLPVKPSWHSEHRLWPMHVPVQRAEHVSAASQCDGAQTTAAQGVVQVAP